MQKIRIDFDNPGLPQHISAVENDSQSRFFQATLYENGKAYTAPEGATYSIMYRGFGPQNQGWYDTINDGAGKRAACAVSGNVVTCEIARQALQVPGHVSIVLCVTTGKGYMLKSWPIECDCKNDRYDSTAEIQSFFYVTQISNESWTQAIQAVEELKNTIDPTLSLSGKAADAAKVGEAVGQLKEDLGQINPDANLQVVFMDGKFPTIKNYGFTVVGGSGFYISDLTTSSMVPFSFSDIAAQIPEYATWDADSKTFTLNLGNDSAKRFGFDTSTNKFIVSNFNQKRNPNIVTLYWVYYNNGCGGLIYEYGIFHHAYTGSPLDVILQSTAKITELSGKLTITNSDVFYMGNWKNGNRETFSFSDIAAQIPEYATWDADSKTFTLNLGNDSSKRFVYDTVTRKFRVDKSLGLINDEDVILYWTYYNKAGGILYNEIALHGTIEKLLSDNDASAVLYDSTKIVSCGHGGFVLSNADGFYIANRSSREMVPFSFSDIAAQIPEYATWDADSKTFTLNLGNDSSKRFGFDTSTNKFIVDSLSTAKPYGLIILYWVYYNKYGGKLAEQIATQLYLENKNEYFTNNSLQKDSFNASFHTGAKDFATVCKRYGMLFNGDEKNGVIAVDTCESFLWFTDPHLFTGHTDIGSIAIMEEYISQIQKYYNSTPTSFVLCGGDWLGNSDTPDMACYKMGYINGICKSMFDKCYMLVGNHDTNYQGKKDADSPTYTTQLSRLAIRNLWYRDIGRAYYDFDGVNTHFYCFDTGNGSQTLEDNNGYGYEQATWFSEKLMNERYDHVAIAAHIYARNTVSGDTVPTDMPPLTRLLLQISSAYNQRSEINVNGKNYNFADATGRVEFMLAGHSHEDYTLMDSGIRIIGTLDCGNHQSYTDDCSFDLVFVDYDNRKIKCIRAGVGEDREMILDN